MNDCGTAARTRTKRVIGHNESLDSPLHRERIERLRTQTHGDMTPESMRTYRANAIAPESAKKLSRK